MNVDSRLLEPGVAHMPDDESPALVSIAISLKRIADVLDGSQCTGFLDVVHDAAMRARIGWTR